ncbi:MAG: NAD(P)/FAD-dependent oxidoreductase [Planctomycetes bacterium]|nr:NAD(P)/FAD-dependent oxidoreductase [Planctomycetota bacterium]
MASHYDAAIVGFGAAGSFLAGLLAKDKKKVVLIERDRTNFGGSCPNKACIPTKFLLHLAKLCPDGDRSFPDNAVRYASAVEEKNRLTAGLRQGSYDSLASSGVDIEVGNGSFVDSHTLRIDRDGGTGTVTADAIFLDTGSRSVMPDIPGLADCPRVYDSTSLIDEKALPKQLVIIGGGYIGIEFAGIYRNFGSEVTILQRGPAIVPREDDDMRKAITDRIGDMGIRLRTGASVVAVRNRDDAAEVVVERDSGDEVLRADAVLVATGRVPVTDGLSPEKAGLSLTDKGGIRVDTRLRTDAPHIYVMGDAAGAMQFTYIASDDARIAYDNHYGEAKRTTENRGAVPFCTFFDPTFSRVGLTEGQAREKGIDYSVHSAAASAVAKAKLLGRGKPVGLMKGIVDKTTNRLVGVHLFCEESHEMITVAKVAIDAGLDYRMLRDLVIPHPTMNEAYNTFL